MPGTTCPLFNFSPGSPTCFVPSLCISGFHTSLSGARVILAFGLAMEQQKFGGRPFEGLNPAVSYSVSLFLSTLSMPGERCWYCVALLCASSQIPSQTVSTEKRMLLSSPAVNLTRRNLACECGCLWGHLATIFPYDLAAPLLVVSPSGTTADHFYILLKMVFGVFLCVKLFAKFALFSTLSLVLYTPLVHPHTLALM